MKRFLLTDYDEDDSIDLFAMHSPLESYLLAYKLNQTIGTQFRNATEKMDLHSDQPYFNRFVWSATDEGVAWELISNHYTFTKQKKENDLLFSLQIEEKKVLIRELSQVNYFLKVPQKELDKSTIDQMQTMDDIQMLYPITETKIKQNPNLIFD